MAAWVRGFLARSTARHLAGVRFCDSCSEVCDAACRAGAERRSVHLALATHAPLR
ncbi:hypothetical protein ABZ484_34100 [Streptomyces sp. NPDC006393]|uniref:hypothetical protein n=1 Tax=Streptomyces sp. NPDC006393 TaxID=3156763 RepID=UPI0033D94854